MPGAAPPLADREVHPRVLQHPLGVIGFRHGRLGGKKRRIEADRGREILDGEMDMESFHGGTGHCELPIFLYNCNHEIK
jgi:hypothetical protein